MSLDDAYKRVSKNKISSGLSIGSRFPSIEKDPTIKKLTEDVFSQMAELDRRDNPEPDPIPSNSMELRNYDFAEAIKELHSMLKKGK